MTSHNMTQDLLHLNFTNHMTNSTNQTSEQTSVLPYDSTTDGILPALVFVSILSVIGVIGNTHVLIVFILKLNSKSTYRVYVIALGIIDLLVSMFHMPGEALDLYYPYTFWSPVTCRLFRFNNFLLSTLSVTVLIVVALDRYRRVCHTMKKQWSVSFAKKLLVGCVTLSVVLASPSLVLFGNRTIIIQNITMGQTCFINDEFKDTKYIVMWIGSVYLLTASGGVIIVFAYISIGFTVKKQSLARAYLTKQMSLAIGRIKQYSFSKVRFEEREGTAKEQVSSEQKSNTKKENENAYHIRLNGQSSISTSLMENINVTEGREQTNINPSVENGADTSRGSSFDSVFSNATAAMPKPKDSDKVTKTVCMITAVFIVSHVPYLTFGVIFGIYPDFKIHLNRTEMYLYRFAMRLVLLNNVCNPFIYGVFDKRFVKAFKEMYRVCYKNTSH